jgi:hypothetical protein
MQLWMCNAAGTWQAQPLAGTHYLTPQGGSLHCQTQASHWHALLHPWQDIHHPATYLLLVSPAANVRLNGQRPFTLSVLQDRDEIAVGAATAYFTTEMPAVVVVFPGVADTLYCPMCRSPLAAGQPAVQCTRCQRWYHQDTERPCWTYHTHCLCGAPTHGEYTWQPESPPTATGGGR